MVKVELNWNRSIITVFVTSAVLPEDATDPSSESESDVFVIDSELNNTIEIETIDGGINIFRWLKSILNKINKNLNLAIIIF